MGIKILHTADVHFGVENYGRIDNTTGLHSRLLDFARSFSFCVDKAIAENVDLFILAGDAYKTANPTPTHQKFLLQNLLRLQAAGIAIVIVVGNHDHPLSFGKAHALDVYSDLPLAGFYVFSRPGRITINTKNGPVQIVGIPWPSRQNLLTKSDFRYKDFDKITEYISSAVADIITRLASELDPSLPAVLTGHLTVSTGVFSGSEKRAVFGNDPLFLPSALAIAPFNYVALGHLHRHQNLGGKGSVPIIYSGSIERVDFGEVNDTKGFVLVEVETYPDGNGSFKRIANVSFQPLPVRRMLEINVHLQADGDFFTKQILDEIKKIDLQDAIVKLFYHLPAGVADTTDVALVYRALAAAWFVAAVIPIVKPTARHSRFSGDNHQDFSATELLDKYFTHKGIARERANKLLQDACCIIDQVNTEAMGDGQPE
jgi:exonuclease SbcD